MGPPKRQELVERESQLVACVGAKLSTDEVGPESIEPRLDRRVRGEHVAPSGGRQGFVQSASESLPKLAGAFEGDEGGVSLVQVADLGGQTHGPQKPPAADPERHLLEDSRLLVPAVKLRSDPAVRRRVFRVVGVQKVDGDVPETSAPGAQPNRGPGPRKANAHPLAVRVAHRSDRQRAGVVEREVLALRPASVDDLTEEPLLVQESDADHRHAEIVRGLEVVPRNIPQSTRVERQCLGERELEAEESDGIESRFAVGRPKPRPLLQLRGSIAPHSIDQRAKLGAAPQVAQAISRHGLHDQPGVPAAAPEIRSEALPDPIRAVAPCGTQIEGDLGQRLGALRGVRCERRRGHSNGGGLR